MEFLRLDDNWDNPEVRELEIVERKGLGHPDTLADALAERISTAYSRYCLERFGAVLHHNVDKLYIGGGLFKSDFGCSQMIEPVKVVVNGRMSNRMGNEPIDLAGIQEGVISEYLGQILPHLDASSEVTVSTNSTQHTKRPYWFSPRDRRDLPELDNLRASDTSVYVAHAPFTLCEELAFQLEQYFWLDEGTNRHPRFNDVGQDIKSMVLRTGREIDITLCVPLISSLTSSYKDYCDRLRQIEHELGLCAAELVGDRSFGVKVRINPTDGGYRVYLLGTGSCIECGEEGLVGRGNTNNGVISVSRLHSMESPYGKNPMYHTGRVLGYLTTLLAGKIHAELGVGCTILAMSKNSQSLIPPAVLSISLEKAVDEAAVGALVIQYFLEADYLAGILSTQMAR